MSPETLSVKPRAVKGSLGKPAVLPPCNRSSLRYGVP
ncbi:hypothetical protein VPHK391_0098 [Vibrio phage K391]